MHPYLDSEKFACFAHRGGALEFPENTMTAFQGAVDMGYRYIETDVHATRDGVLLAFHDTVLDRVTDMVGDISQMSYDEVKKAKISGTDPIPLFEELVTSFPDIKINIDPKADTSVLPLIKALKQHNLLERVCIGSFSEKRLDYIRKEFGPRVCTSMAGPQVARLRFRSWGIPTGRFSAYCAQVPTKVNVIPVVDKRFCDKAHELGLKVHVWTIDDEAEMERLIDCGVDGLMTDRPSVLKRVAEKHGLWA